MRRVLALLVSLIAVASGLLGAPQAHAQVPMPIVKVYVERLDCNTIRITNAYYGTNDVLDVSMRWQLGDPDLAFNGTGDPVKSGAWTKTFGGLAIPKYNFTSALDFGTGDSTKRYIADIPGCELRNQMVPSSVQAARDAFVQENVLSDRANTPRPRLLKIPTIIGDFAVGSKVTFGYRNWDHSAALISGLWFRLVNGRWELIRNGQDPVYTIAKADRGHLIGVMQVLCFGPVSCGWAFSKPVRIK